MAIIFLIGRIIFGCYFINSGYSHFKNVGHMAGYAASKKVPAPKLAIIGSGILLFIGGLSMLLGIAPWIGVIALVLFLVPVSFKMHDYWNETDPGARMNSRIGFYKNMALIGALLMIVMIAQPWTYSLAL